MSQLCKDHYLRRSTAIVTAIVFAILTPTSALDSTLHAHSPPFYTTIVDRHSFTFTSLFILHIVIVNFLRQRYSALSPQRERPMTIRNLSQLFSPNSSTALCNTNKLLHTLQGLLQLTLATSQLFLALDHTHTHITPFRPRRSFTQPVYATWSSLQPLFSMPCWPLHPSPLMPTSSWRARFLSVFPSRIPSQSQTSLVRTHPPLVLR